MSRFRLTHCLTNHCIFLLYNHMTTSSIPNAKGIKFVHSNIRSLYKKIDQVSILYSEVDFVLLTETWLDKRHGDNLLNINGMTIYLNDRCNAPDDYIQQKRIPKRGGGVSIHVRDQLVPYVTSCAEATEITPDYETLGLYVSKPNNRRMFVMCVYKPPQGSIQKLIDFFKVLFEIRAIMRSEVWILGDFNLNLLLRNDLDVIRMNRFLREKGLCQLVREPTRLTNRGGTCIDWIITNSQHVSLHGILNDLLSDHFPVFVVKKKGREKLKKVVKKVRVYRNYNENLFKALFDEIDWNSYFNCVNVNVLWEMIYKHIESILAIMCPFKNITIREEKFPWFTNEIYDCIKQRRSYVKLFRATRNNDIYIMSKYFRNKCNNLVRNAKSEYIKSSLDANVANPRKYWRVLNCMLKSSTKTFLDFEFKDPITQNSVLINETPDFLNTYFANVGARKMPNAKRFVDDQLPCHIFYIGDVATAEVKKLIADIDISKDSCIEGMNARVLKAAFSVKPKALAHLFDNSLSQGNFPSDWAVGYINVLPKGGDRTNPSNWRPITQTCLPAKLLEKIVQKRLLIHLNQNNVIGNLVLELVDLLRKLFSKF